MRKEFARIIVDIKAFYTLIKNKDSLEFKFNDSLKDLIATITSDVNCQLLLLVNESFSKTNCITRAVFPGELEATIITQDLVNQINHFFANQLINKKPIIAIKKGASYYQDLLLKIHEYHGDVISANDLSQWFLFSCDRSLLLESIKEYYHKKFSQDQKGLSAIDELQHKIQSFCSLNNEMVKTELYRKLVKLEKIFKEIDEIVDLSSLQIKDFFDRPTLLILPSNVVAPRHNAIYYLPLLQDCQLDPVHLMKFNQLDLSEYVKVHTNYDFDGTTCNSLGAIYSTDENNAVNSELASLVLKIVKQRPDVIPRILTSRASPANIIIDILGDMTNLFYPLKLMQVEVRDLERRLNALLDDACKVSHKGLSFYEEQQEIAQIFSTMKATMQELNQYKKNINDVHQQKMPMQITFNESLCKVEAKISKWQKKQVISITKICRLYKAIFNISFAVGNEDHISSYQTHCTKSDILVDRHYDEAEKTLVLLVDDTSKEIASLKKKVENNQFRSCVTVMTIKVASFDDLISNSQEIIDEFKEACEKGCQKNYTASCELLSKIANF